MAINRQGAKFAKPRRQQFCEAKGQRKAGVALTAIRPSIG